MGRQPHHFAHEGAIQYFPELRDMTVLWCAQQRRRVWNWMDRSKPAAL